MSKEFKVFYNGHPVAVTAVENDTFIVQITYKPIHIQLKNNDSKEEWIDVETQQETFISAELGKLIAAHLCTV